MPLVGTEDAAAASLLLSTSSAFIETGLWVLKVQGADVKGAKETLVVAKRAVIANCTAAVISAAANTSSSAVASASAAADALGSQCPRVIL